MSRRRNRRADAARGQLARALGSLRRLWAALARRFLPKPPARPLSVECLEDRTAASVSPGGGEFLVNSYTNNAQQTFVQGLAPQPQYSQQAVAMDGSGNYVVTWSSQNQDGNGWGVFAQRYDAAGARVGNEFRVNTTTADNQQAASVAMDPAGDFVITWMSHNQDGSGWGVYGQRYDAAGVAQGGEFRVNTTTQDDQMYPRVAMDGTGNFVATWSSHNQDGDGWGVYAQRYDAAGVAQGGEFQVNTSTQNDQYLSAVGMDGGGDFVITWMNDTQNGGGWGIFAQRYNAAGVAQGGEFQVDTNAQDTQTDPGVAVSPGGGFVVTWSNQSQNRGPWNVYARRYDASGTPLGVEFQVNTTTKDDQQYSNAVMRPNGDFLITWSSHNQDGNGWGVYAQRFGPTGAAEGPEFQVNTTTQGDQMNPSVAADANGSAVIVWSSANQDGSNWGVYARQYALSSHGILVTPTTGLVTTQAGDTVSFTIALASQPSGNVTIGLSSSDTTSGGTLSVPGVTFTPTNWNVAQTVTVTGVDDHIANGDVQYTIILSPASSPDAGYNGLAGPTVSLTNQQTDVAGISISPTSGLVTTETGGTATFQVLLTSQPTAPVTVTLTSSDTTAGGTLSSSSLTFDASNWNAPQAVTVTGVDDHIVSGDVSYTVSSSASSGDPYYSGLAGPAVSLLNQEKDIAGISVNPTSGLVTTEAGGTASFQVVLTSQPASPVTVPLTSSNTTSGGTLSTSSLGFDASNWNVPQTMTVSGVDDHIVNGDVAYQVITDPAVSTDPAYSGLDAADVSLVNQEADVSGFTITPTSGLVTTWAGGSTSFTVALTSQPAAAVTLDLASSDTTSGGYVSVPGLTFTSADWNVPQTVTVTGLDAPTASDYVIYWVRTLPAMSTDPVYNGLDPADVSVTNLGTDTPAAPVPSQPAPPSPSAGGGTLQPATPSATGTPANPKPGPAIENTSSSKTGAVNPGSPNGAEVQYTLTAASPGNSVLDDTPPAATGVPAGANAAPLAGSTMVSASTAVARLSAAPSGGGGGQAGQAAGPEQADAKNEKPDRSEEPPVVQAPPSPSPEGKNVAPATQMGPALPPANAQVSAVPPRVAPALPVAPIPRLHTQAFWSGLDASADQLEAEGRTERKVEIVFAAGVVVSAGYFLLTARGVYLALSALLARPLWKQFDPLDILFAWEEEKGRRLAELASAQDDEEETLQTMVG